MHGTIRACALAGLTGLAFADLTSPAHAGAFGLREQSAEAQGESFAGAASGSGGVSSMFWNPAVITQREGTAAEGNLTLINLNAEIRPTLDTSPLFGPLGASGNIGQGALIPASAASYQLNDRLWIGFQTGAPFGLVTKPNQNWAGELYGRSSRIFSLAFNPVVAFKINEWLSVAGGPNVEYFRLTLRQALPITLPPAELPSAFVKGESWGVGATAGVTITPWAGTVLGLGYRSSIHHDIDGSLGLPVPQLLPLAGQIKMNFNTPEKLSAGLTQALAPDLRLNFGFEYDNWSRVGDIGLVSKTSGAVVNNLPLNFKDGFLYAVGAEYDASPALTLRGGFSYEDVPITTGNRSVRLPDNDRYTVSVGATYRWSDTIALHAAYSHVFLDRSNVFAGPGTNYPGFFPFAGIVDANADIVSVGFRYVFGAPAIAYAPPPIARKF